jgi:antitoxin ParD1/3/4
MPTRDVVLTKRPAELIARLEALRDAARVGIADIEAGRFRTLRSPAELHRHLGALLDEGLRTRIGPHGFPASRSRDCENQGT